MESVPAFLDELAARLVPACDPAVVQAVFARASAGYTGPRGRDGLRVTAITPSGVPFEASVTGGAGRSSAALRYVTETATGMPFFGPRLAAQRAALDDLVAWLPPVAQPAAAELQETVDVLFPDPAAVPARRRFATTFGIVHRDDVPAGIAGLKLYGNLRAGDGALARAAAHQPAIATLHRMVDDLGFLTPHFLTVEVDAAGRLRHKLYLRTARATPAGLVLLARRFGTDATEVFGMLERAGVPEAAWTRPFFACVETGADGDGGPGLSFHLSAKALRLDTDGMAGLARHLMGEHAGDGFGGAAAGALEALDAASDRAGGAWTTTVVAAGLARRGAAGKVNVYVAPAAPAGDDDRLVPPVRPRSTGA